LQVAGKEVFAAEVADADAAFKGGPEVPLEAGVHPLRAEFTRSPGMARLELFWQAPDFRTEPLSYQQLGHLPAKVPAHFTADQTVEHGRYLAEELSCTRCHQPADGDKLTRGLGWRQGPDLSQVGARAYPGWVFQWLADPHRLRPSA